MGKQSSSKKTNIRTTARQSAHTPASKPFLQRPSTYTTAGVIGLVGLAVGINYCSDTNIIKHISSSHDTTDSLIISTTTPLQDSLSTANKQIRTVNKKADAIYGVVQSNADVLDKTYEQTKENKQGIDSIHTQLTQHDNDVKSSLNYQNGLRKETVSSATRRLQESQKSKEDRLDDLVKANAFGSAKKTNKGPCLDDDLYHGDRGEAYSLKPLQKDSYMRSYEATKNETGKKSLFRRKK